MWFWKMVFAQNVNGLQRLKKRKTNTTTKGAKAQNCPGQCILPGVFRRQSAPAHWARNSFRFALAPTSPNKIAFWLCPGWIQLFDIITFHYGGNVISLGSVLKFEYSAGCDIGIWNECFCICSMFGLTPYERTSKRIHILVIPPNVTNSERLVTFRPAMKSRCFKIF